VPTPRAAQRTRSKTPLEDVLSLSHTWISHKRERQNTLRVVFSNAPGGGRPGQALLKDRRFHLRLGRPDGSTESIALPRSLWKAGRRLWLDCLSLTPDKSRGSGVDLREIRLWSSMEVYSGFQICCFWDTYRYSFTRRNVFWCQDNVLRFGDKKNFLPREPFFFGTGIILLRNKN